MTGLVTRAWAALVIACPWFATAVSAVCAAGAQEPPEVTWLALELEAEDGAVPLLSPLELFGPELVELADFGPELPELELPELAEPELEAVGPEECRVVVAACAEPGSVTPMPAAASTLAVAATRVMARSLDWCRFLAAIAASRWSSRARAVMMIPPDWLLADLQHGR